MHMAYMYIQYTLFSNLDHNSNVKKDEQHCSNLIKNGLSTCN